MNSRLVFASCFVLGFSAGAGNWPGWRGPAGNGVSSETAQLPESWSTNQNVRWHVSLPGPGNSSPIVWGNKVFITQWIKGENRRTVMCFDRADGKLLWQSGVTYTEEEPTQENNPYCSATPVTDGERVIALFGSAGLYCCDFSGTELWHRDLGKMNHMFGSGASPVLHGDLCFVNFGPDEKARLIAINKRDGQIAWEADPPKVDPSEQSMPGPGGRGGFGPGMFIAAQIISQADKNGDGKLTKDELVALADAWFGKLDSEKNGKITQSQFIEKLPEVLPPPQGFGGPPGGGPPPGAEPPGGGPPPGEGRPPGGGPPPGGGGPGGFGPGRFIGPGLFAALDTDKDGSLTKEELSAAFAQWFADWDSAKTGFVTEDQVRDGLNAALPRPEFRGPGGPGGPGGRGRGPGGPGGMGGPGGSWSSPIVVHVGDHDELIMNFPNRLVAYDPATGKELWLSKGLGGTIYTTPLWGDTVLLATSSDMNGGNAIAVKPGGSGDVTESQRLWRLPRIKGAIGSGVIYDGYIYTIDRDGIAACLDLKTGEKIWEERLRGGGSRTSSWSSILLANGRLYIPNQSGDVFVLRAGPKFELLATNALNEPTNASLAASDRDLFIRTDKGLWCLASLASTGK